MKSFHIERLHPYETKAPEGATVLPGFVKDGVTYESHTFFVEHEPARPVREGYAGPLRFKGDTFITVRHGGGWERLRVRHMMGGPLRVLIEAGHLEEAFFLCWGLFDLRRDAHDAGANKMKQDIFEGFVDGRLKKRKVRGSNNVRVTLEPKPVVPTEKDGISTYTIDLGAPNYV